MIWRRFFNSPTGAACAGSCCPSAPYLAAAARGGLSVTWKIVLIVELLGRSNGIGFALNLFFQNFNVAGILAYGLSFAGIMLLLEFFVLQPLEQRVNAWR
jgi:NitT/TauT family transport system permease protein